MNLDDDAGMMIEFENPKTGDTMAIANVRHTMLTGWSRHDARLMVQQMIREAEAAGFRRVPKPL